MGNCWTIIAIALDKGNLFAPGPTPTSLGISHTHWRHLVTIVCPINLGGCSEDDLEGL